ncbi:zinc-binding dehydrogenase [Actinomadura rudentiformis]|uniref:Zinc-binding dehydrogenase n=1 Tax=Actinomadura rudentiformis TaxID=359158 RepID=A0A6H9YQ33_9ACTN|nr:zinc-binding dehydrogenase [Actinomadura rudentiformis]KAB2341298.1 zinc-binding dehydrogenase [Actinomadura rudentiformis]
MRAVWLKEFGGPEVLVAGEAPDPVPGPGQVLVNVAYANITFVETQFRRGLPGPFKAQPPVIPGNGVGGVVAEVGAGVDAALVGKRVISSLRGEGGYAEKVVVDAASLLEVPDGLALDDAVALLADGRTAIMMLTAVTPKSGERILVEAAAGGVGTLLVQLAKAAGLTVVAAAGGARKTALAAELGADVVVDYTDPAWTGRIREATGGVDIVMDAVGGDIGRAAFELLGEGGRIINFGLASGEWAGIDPETAAERGVTIVEPTFTPELLRGYAERALAEGAAGRLRPVIGQRFPLDRAADAHAAIETRATVGKTLLEVDQ